MDPLDPAYSSADGVLFDKSQTTLIECPMGKVGSYSMPNTVTSIASSAFKSCTGLTNITISDGVTSIGDYAFQSCTSLTGVTIGSGVTSIGNYAFEGCAFTGVTIPKNLTSIGYLAFAFCTNLSSLTIPASVSNIGDQAFLDCTNLTGAYFQRNAPIADAVVFNGDSHVTVYYLPGTTGWGPTFGGRPTALWNPQAQNLSMQANQFGFTITGTSNLVIVVEASASLANPIWSPVATNTLTGGSSYFSDPQWSNYPGRFYRFRSP